MYPETFAIPPRHVRRISFVIAAALHAVAIALLLNYMLGQFQQMAVVKPVVQSQIVDSEIAEKLAAEIAQQPEPRNADAGAVMTAVEPGESVIDAVVAKIRNYRDAETGPDPLETIRRNAALLEQISNAGEVDRMAGRLRDAMGATSVPFREPNADTPAVDWNAAVQAGGKRVVDGDRVEIHETFIDDKGGASTMIHARTPIAATGDFAYTVALVEAGRHAPPNKCTQEEFELAAERIAPFEVIDQFPLLRELHRSAIVPIMQKMTQDEAEKSPTSRPSEPSEVVDSASQSE
ncbi:MAG: hypothetical protein H6819_07830 [Phycisphaerales bacterium]|nr:hypothetical protein [Phycisphaerales bacterium]MCB9854316.1 hypothetical protein [Phycisphaerales bacterium]MCB9863517.1 hypothetical protein [Phycisphaerales bacterium]